MPRMARVVCPNVPHHITQRGVRRFNVFLDDADHLRYLELMARYAPRFGLTIMAYCLMTNHVHVVAVPEHQNSIARVFGYCHGVYSAEFNKKYGKSGHVWQARPYSCVLDEPHTWAAIRYVERNPVRAHIVARAEDYAWSSARAHCGLSVDALLSQNWRDLFPIKEWGSWLDGTDAESEKRVRARTYTGKPCGNDTFVKGVETVVGRALAPRKPGPKPRDWATQGDPGPWRME